MSETLWVASRYDRLPHSIIPDGDIKASTGGTALFGARVSRVMVCDPDVIGSPYWEEVVACRLTQDAVINEVYPLM